MKKVIPPSTRSMKYTVHSHPSGGYLAHPEGRRYDNYVSFIAYPTPEKALLACGADPKTGESLPRKKFQVWVEGYRSTGDSSEAKFVQEWTAGSFEQAVHFCVNQIGGKLDRANFNAAKLTYWGCELFDNEADARKSFG